MIGYIWKSLLFRAWFRVIGKDISNAAILGKALKTMDQEYEGNESWSNGKKEALQTLVICVICLIVFSYIVC